MHQGKILRFRITDQDIVLGNKEHIQDLPLRSKRLAAAGGAQNQTVGGLVLLPVGQDHVAGCGIEPVVQGIPALEDLLGGEGHHNGNSGGGKSPLDLDLVYTQRKRRYEALFLLEVQSGKLAVILLGNTGSSGNVIVQLPFGIRHVHHQEGHLEHPLISALQVPEDVLCFTCVGGNIRGDDIHIEAFPDSSLLGIDLHTVDIGDLPLDGFDGFVLVHAADMDAEKDITFGIQQFPQNTVVHFRCGDLQEGSSAELGAHLEPPCVAEPEGGRCNEVLHMEAGRCQPVPIEGEPFSVWVKDAMQQRQPFLAV